MTLKEDTVLDLTPDQQGTMIIFALNHLPDMEEMTRASRDGEDEGCCKDCCAPCGVLHELVESNIIDYVVQQSSIFGDGGWEWWVDGQVDRAWLGLVWRQCVNEVPGHRDGTGGVHPPRPDEV